jgi:hypothetical protein
MITELLFILANIARVQDYQMRRKKKVTAKIEDKEFPRIVHYLAMEYGSMFLGGLDGIDQKRQNRLNEIEDKIEELGVSFSDWTDLVMAHFKGGK